MNLTSNIFTNLPTNSKYRIPQNELNDLFEPISTTKHHEPCYFVGDPKFSNMDWETLRSPNEYEDKIVQTFSVLSRTQLIDFLTVGKKYVRRRHYELIRINNRS